MCREVWGRQIYTRIAGFEVGDIEEAGGRVVGTIKLVGQGDNVRGIVVEGDVWTEGPDCALGSPFGIGEDLGNDLVV